MQRAGLDPVWKRVDAPESLLAALAEETWDIAFSDHSMPRLNSRDALAIVRERAPDLPLIILSGAISEEDAVAAMNAGAQDYIEKDSLARLIPVVERELRVTRSRREHRQLERIQWENQARKNAILESALDCIITIDHEGRIFEWNRSAESTFGYRRAEVLGKELAELVIPPALRERHRRGLARYLATGESQLLGKRIEFSAMRADGTEFPVELTITNIPVEGQPVFTAFVRDITERKGTEAAFRKKKASLIQAQRIGHIGSWEVDVASQTLEWSEETYRIFGREPGEYAPTADAFVAAVHPDDRAKVRQAAEAAMREGKPYNIEHRIVRPDGSERVVLDQAEVLRDADGRAIQIIGIIQDMTERKRAEDALRESEQRFRQLAEHIKQVFWMSDVNAAQVFYVSPAYEQIWGRTCESLYASTASWLDAVHPDDRSRVVDANSRGQREYVYRIVRPDGAIRWIRNRAFPVRNESGEVHRIAGIAEDITDQRNVETQLRQLQKMESIGQLAAGVAHDFNNILGVIQGHTDMILGGMVEGREVEESLKQIGAAGKRAANLTRQLLAFSRKQEMESQDVNLNEVVNGISKMLERLLGAPIALEFVPAPSLPAVSSDVGMIEQVLLNLAVNARDAMSSGGRLTIRTAARTISENEAQRNPEARAGSFVCLSVSDTGCGIATEILPRIFEPFFTTKAAGKGTGLGLATVYGIVKQHQGWIEVESRVGQGTRFDTFLPASSKPATAKAQPVASAATRGGRETILLAEDEPALRRLAARVLQNLGYEVLEAGSGVEAIQVWEQYGRKVDLLLTDLVMPDGLTGRELAKKMQSKESTLKVIYTSGYSPETAETAFVFREGTNFLQKPYHPRKLAETVRSCLDRP